MGKIGYLDEYDTDKWVDIPDDFPEWKSFNGVDFYDYVAVNMWLDRHKIPPRHFAEKTMLMALTLEEITYIVDALDADEGLGKKIASELSNQSLYQAVAPDSIMNEEKVN